MGASGVIGLLLIGAFLLRGGAGDAALLPYEAPLKVTPQQPVGDGQPPLIRSRRHGSHFPLCSYCCGCCRNRGCGLCCRT